MTKTFDLPLPMIGDYIYVLHIERNSSNVITVSEVRRRRLCTPTNTSFIPYAGIPAYIHDDLKTGSNIIIKDDKVHLILISRLGGNQWPSSLFGGRATCVEACSVYSLDGVDEYGMGIWTLIHSFDYPKEIQAGIPFEGVVTTRAAWYSTMQFMPGFTSMAGALEDGDTQWNYNTNCSISYITRTYEEWSAELSMLVTVPQTGPGGGSSTGQTGQTAFYPTSTGWDFFAMTYTYSQANRSANVTGINEYTARANGITYAHMSRGDAMGCSIEGSDPATGYPEQTNVGGVATYSGSFATRIHAMFPITYNRWNNFAFGIVAVCENPDQYSVGTVKNKIKYVNGTVSDYSLGNYAPPFYYLCGIWGNCEALVFCNSSGNANYTDYVVCKVTDTTFTNRYSIFSRVQDDGTILHVEGIETSQPEVWVDNTFICYLADYGNDRPANKQFWPRTRPPETFCYQRPGVGQLWPRTR